MGGPDRRKKGGGSPNPALAGRDSPAPQLLHGKAEIGDRRELILKERLHRGGRGGGRRREEQEAAAVVVVVGSARGGIHRDWERELDKRSPPVPCRPRSVLTPTGARRPLRSWRQTAARPISARQAAGGGLFFFKPPLPPRAPRPVGTAAARLSPAHGGCLASLWTNRKARKKGGEGGNARQRCRTTFPSIPSRRSALALSALHAGECSSHLTAVSLPPCFRPSRFRA